MTAVFVKSVSSSFSPFFFQSSKENATLRGAATQRGYVSHVSGE